MTTPTTTWTENGRPAGGYQAPAPIPATVTAVSASTTGLVVKGVASQTASLQEWQNNAGTVLARVNATGDNYAASYNVGTPISNSLVGVTATGTGVRPLVVKGISGQTADLQQWQDNAGIVARVDKFGNIIAGVDDAIAQLNSFAVAPSLRPFAVRGANGQTANLADFQRFDTSPGVIVAANGSLRVTASGQANSIDSAAWLNVATSASDKGLVVRGAASQSANLAEFQDSNGNILARVDQVGSLVVGKSAEASFVASGPVYAGQGPSPAYFSATINAVPLNANVRGLVVRGVASQSANLAEFQNSAGTVLANVFPDGAFLSPSFKAGANIGQALLESVIQAASAKGLVVRGAASQSASLAEFQNSAGTVLHAHDQFARTSFIGDGSAFRAADNGVVSRVAVKTSDAGEKGLVVRGFASQTANLAEFQNSAGTIIAQITAIGQVSAWTTDSAGNAGAMRTFQLGAVDSAGTGFRTVRVAN